MKKVNKAISITNELNLFIWFWIKFWWNWYSQRYMYNLILLIRWNKTFCEAKNVLYYINKQYVKEVQSFGHMILENNTKAPYLFRDSKWTRPGVSNMNYLKLKWTDAYWKLILNHATKWMRSFSHLSYNVRFFKIVFMCLLWYTNNCMDINN